METVSDCYAALGVVHSQWTPIPGRFKDYIALPKPNMYQSLHTTVIGPGQRRIEVQIRTQDMHRTAEYGIAAHWKYKERTGGLDAKDAAQFAWLRQLMEFQQEVADPAEFLDSVKVDLFTDEVYVFTPRGELKVFPRGATPVDFAYAIHSEVGDHCAGARVNGAMVPLRYQLHNGDTSRSSPARSSTRTRTGSSSSRPAAPARGSATTSGPRSGSERDQARHASSLERELHKRRPLSFSRCSRGHNEVGRRSPTHFKVTHRGRALRAGRLRQGLGAQRGHDVAGAEARTGRRARACGPSFFEKTVRQRHGKDGDQGIRIDDVDDVLVRFAKCCNPLPGDPITGWITPRARRDRAPPRLPQGDGARPGTPRSR